MEDFLSLLADAGDSLKTVVGVKPLSLQNMCGNVLLHLAISLGNFKDVENLIKLGISVHAKVSDNKTALCRAVESGNDAIVDILAYSGADINEITASGLSLLHFAVSKGYADVVDVLLDFGAPVDSEDFAGLTPLYRAAERYDLDTAEVILDHGANSDITLLNLAVERSCINATRYFAQLYFDVDFLYSDLQSIVYQAANAGKLSILKEFINNGVNLYSRDERGYSFLHIAAENDNVVAARTLIDVGVNVDIKGGWWSWTSLHVAAANNSYSTAKLLIEKNASLDSLTTDGKTPLTIAQKSNAGTSMISLLSNKKTLLL